MSKNTSRVSDLKECGGRMFRKEAAPIRHSTGDIKTNVDLIRKILSTEASSSLPSSRPIMTSNPAIVYSGDVLPRGRLFESWERTRHSKPVHWFIECDIYRWGCSFIRGRV